MIKKIAKAYLNWHDRNIGLMKKIDLVCLILYSYLMVCAITQGVFGIFFGLIVAFWALSCMTVVVDFIDTYKQRNG